ncbi:MAG: hypothetical protein K0U54_07150 [Bacteroidetes bacterium]|nr:hypothetical protein [Bacteroidota bacterium]
MRRIYWSLLSLFGLFLLLKSGPISAQVTSWEPQNEIRFEEDFKERYDGDRYDYEGKKVVKTTKGGNGDYNKYKTKEENPDIKEVNNETEVDTPNLGFNFVNWLFVFMLIAAVFYLAYIVLNEGGSGIFNFRGNQRIGEDSDEINSENIEATDLNTLIKKAEKEGDYRLAIRYNYLLILQILSLKNFIKFEDDKTNGEYYNEIQEQPFSESFAYTSYLYNYVWYGEFLIDTNQYNKAKTDFDHLIQKVG